MKVEITPNSPVKARCENSRLIVELIDGRILSVPLDWFPRLAAATVSARNNIELSTHGLHWPDIDEDLSIEGLLKGVHAPKADTVSAA